MEPKEHFYYLLEKDINDPKSKKKDNYVIDTAKYDTILSALKLKKGEACEKGAHFKQWVKECFKIVQIGTTEYVCSNDDNSLPVAKKEELFDIIKR